MALPSRTVSRDGINMRHFGEVTAGGEAQNVAPDPLDPDLIYGGTVEKLDLRTEQTHDIDPTMAHPDLYRSTWTLPLAFSERDPKVLYFARQRVFRTADGGDHWDVISPDLTRERPGAPANLDEVGAAHDLGTGPPRGVVYALAPSRVAAGDLWAGTDDGLVWRTRDDGAHWQDVTPPELTPWSKVGILDASHFDADTVYAAVDRHRLDDRRPYVYRTHDGGATWKLVVEGIAAGDFVNAVREDPVRPGLLYAATENGMYASFDDGDHWQSLQLDLPPSSVRDIDVHGDDVVIATHGRGIFVLDGVGPLRQVDGEVAAAPAWLFAPSVAYRVRPEGFAGTPLPLDEPRAANPPAGAWIDYALSRTAAGPVTLEITDESGELVRRYSSADAPKPFNASRSKVAPEWFASPVTLSAEPGMHRFVWPLRWPAPPALADGDPYADGVWAPPGRYRVTLTVDGHRLERELTVAPDPRVDLDPGVYRRQFAFAREIFALRGRIAAAAESARSLGKKLDAAIAAGGPDAAGAAALRERVAEVSGFRPATNPNNAWPFPPRRLASLRWVGSALETLARAVDGADAEPSADARTSWERLQPIAEEALADWARIEGEELPALDRARSAAGLARIGE